MKEISELTVEQVGSFFNQVKPVFEMLHGDGKEQEKKKELEKDELILLVKALKHRLPKGLT